MVSCAFRTLSKNRLKTTIISAHQQDKEIPSLSKFAIRLTLFQLGGCPDSGHYEKPMVNVRWFQNSWIASLGGCNVARLD